MMFTWHDTVTLKARWVIPVDAPPVDGGEITLRRGRIASIGPAHSTSKPIDLGDVAILPGLVNPHTHLEFSQLQQPLGQPGNPFCDWIEQVINWRRTLLEASEQQTHRWQFEAISTGLRESLNAGITSLGDIITHDVSSSSQIDTPIHVVGFRELLGLKPDRICREQETVNGYLASMGKAALPRDDGSESGRPETGWPTVPALSPHAPYTVHPELLEWACLLSQQHRLPLAMHLAESEQELEMLGRGTGPLVDLLRQMEAWDPTSVRAWRHPGDLLPRLSRAHRALVIHGNYLRPSDWDFLAERRETMSVIFCPRTHAYFCHRTYPLGEMIRAGVRVAIGTDGRASNPNLNLLEELRFLSARFPDISPDWIVRAGTLSAAEALGMDQVTGSIRPEKLADLTVIPLDGVPVSNPHEAVLQSRRPATMTICRGHPFVHGTRSEQK
jgi:cytosine/adenosine deaminase-related metal-dependent hydrolase